jgi:TRAP-type C4-dicarboxylate transport system substrate-binding protein
VTRTALVIITAALLAAASLGDCSIGGSERVGGEADRDAKVLTLLDPFSNGTELTQFAEEVTRLSDGSLKIRFVDGGSDRADFEAAAIRDVRRGRADLAFAASRAWDEFGVYRLRALHAPMLIDSYKLQGRVLTNRLVAPMLEEIRRLGLVGIGILPGNIRLPLGVTHRLATPSDFSGLTIGTQQSDVADATLQSMGARPQRLPAEVTSVDGVDAIEHSVAAIDSDDLDVDSSHLMTNVPLWPRPLVIFANARSYGRLTSDQRRVLRAAAARTVARKLQTDRLREAEGSANICRKGRTEFDSATSSELSALRDAVEPVYRELEQDPGTRAAIEAIERLKKKTGEPPNELPDCEPAQAPAFDAATEIDGVWRMDTDPSAAGSEGLEENWGRWIYVFDRGKFAITQENQDACTWQYGRFEVDGNRMSWTFTDGGGIAPNDAHNKPGEFFVFDFSAYRDTLTVKPVEGEISPLNFRAKPWRRISDTPSRRYFSKHCPPPPAALRDK